MILGKRPEQRIYQVTRAAYLESLQFFRELIKKACQEHGEINDQDCYDLQLAVDEACTNIITHGYAGMDPGSIIMRIQVSRDRVAIDLIDFGHPFEPSEATMPDIEAGLDDRPMGGFGLFFIYQTMDEISYQTSEDGNCLTIIKFLNEPSD